MIRQTPIVIVAALVCAWAANLRADDWLEFKNGERVTGHYVKTENGVIFFESTRFGALQVSTDEAEVSSGAAPAASPLTGAAGTSVARAVAAAKPFGPETTAAPPVIAATQRHRWKTHIDTLLDFIWASNNATSRETKVLGTTERLYGNEHYLAYANLDYVYNEGLLVQNHFEGRFTWEHQLSHSLYTIAEPDYLQEIRENKTYQYEMRAGVGAQLFQTQRSQVRVAVLSYFSRLAIPAVHTLTYDVYPAVRLDSEWEIWHGLKFKQEGNAYYVPHDNTDGVDNTFSLVKDLFGGLTLTLQHDYHHVSIPQASITRNELKLLLGYTF